MQIENLITRRKRLDRRYNLSLLLRETSAAVAWALLIAITGTLIYDNPINLHNKIFSRPLSQTIKIKSVEVEAKEIDWSTDLVGYFRFRGQQIGYNDYEITKLHEVMDCENGLHTADRKNYLYDGENGHYTAAGFAMITNSTWRQHKCTGSKWNGMDNINCFYKIIGKNGLSDYSESKYGPDGWGRLFDEKTIKFIKL